MKSLKCNKCGAKATGKGSFDSVAELAGYTKLNTGYICPVCFQPARKPRQAVVERQYHVRSRDDEQ